MICPALLGEHDRTRSSEDDRPTSGEQFADAGLYPLANIGPQNGRISWQREVQPGIQGGQPGEKGAAWLLLALHVVDLLRARQRRRAASRNQPISEW